MSRTFSESDIGFLWGCNLLLDNDLKNGGPNITLPKLL